MIFLFLLSRLVWGALTLQGGAVQDLEAHHVQVASPSPAALEDASRWRSRAYAPTATLNFGAYGRPVLLRIPLQCARAGRWWLVSDLRTPEFLRARLGGRDLGDFGSGHPFAGRPAGTLQVALPLDLKAGGDTLWLWASDPNGDCLLEARLVPDALFPSRVQDHSLWAGLVLGTLFFALAAALAYWRIAREAAFGWYALHVCLGWLWSLAKNGILSQYLWPSSPQWNRVAPELLSWSTVGAYALFVIGALELRRHFPRGGRVLAGLAWAQFAVGAVALLSVAAPAFHARIHAVGDWDYLQLLTLGGLFAAHVWRAVRGDRLARAMLVPLVPLFLTMFFGTLNELSWLAPEKDLETSLLLVAGLFEYLGLTVVLALELYRRERERLALVREFDLRLAEQYERFRMGIAADLHDDFSQRLLAARLQIHGQEGAGDLEARLAELGDSVRYLSRNLQLPAPVQGRLLPVLQGLASSMSGPGVAVHLEVRSWSELDPARSVVLYRLIQEALSNAVRHGRASKVEVLLEERRGELRVEIRDDGRGFAAGILAGGGLRTIRQRVDELGALLETRSAPGEGATLVVWVPLKPPVRG